MLRGLIEDGAPSHESRRTPRRGLPGAIILFPSHLHDMKTPGAGSAYGRRLSLAGAGVLLLPLTLACLAVGSQGISATAMATRSQPVYRSVKRFASGDVLVDFSLTRLAHEPTPRGSRGGPMYLVTFRLAEARSGRPLTGVIPQVWIDARRAETGDSEVACAGRLQDFAGGGPGVRADIDFTAYSLLTLNVGGTISVIRPRAAFTILQTEEPVVLPGEGADWILSEDQGSIYVTLPEQGAVAVIDLAARQLVRTLRFGDDARPLPLARQPDGRHVWVALDGAGQVAAIDTASNRVAARFPVGAGPHNFAFTGDSRYAYVGNGVGSIAVMDARSLVKLTDIRIGEAPLGLAYSPVTRLIYAAAFNESSIRVIDPDKQAIKAEIAVKAGIAALAFEAEGRYGLALNRVENTLSVIDASRHAVMGVIPVPAGADRLAFTHAYAYAHSRRLGKLSVIDLAALRRGELAAHLIEAGQAEPGPLPTANMLAASPAGDALIIANTRDEGLYYHAEGGKAAPTFFSNYRMAPKGIMAVGQALRETAPGIYSAPVRLAPDRHFDVFLLIDRPRVAQCIHVLAAGKDEAAGIPSLALIERTVLPCLERSLRRQDRPGFGRHGITNNRIPSIAWREDWISVTRRRSRAWGP
jgi:YVTN family beta-propeller protein